MQTIFRPANPIDAQRLVALLAEEGIEAHVQGTYLSGAIGELPAGDLLRVWVEDGDATRARELVAEFEAERRALAEVDDKDDDADDTASSLAKKGGVPSGLVGLFFGLVIGFGVAYWHLRLPYWTDAVDYDDDGIVDTAYDYRSELLTRISDDRNGDGEFDQVTDAQLDGNGRGRGDNDFDGRFEYEYRYRRNQVASVELDEDGDGFKEYRAEFTDGLPAVGHYFDAKSQAEFKREHYEHGVLVRTELDTDRDGTFETKRTIDATGEIVP
jgi:hypothetical protein